MHGTDDELRADLIIDLVAGRPKAGQAAGGGPAIAGASPDEALVAELAALSEIDWPADDAGSRIVLAVSAVARERRPAGARHLRTARSRWLAAAAVIAAAALTAGAAAVLGGPGHPAAGPTPASSKPGGSPGGSPTPAKSASLTAMMVISTPGALRAVGAVRNGAGFLDCVTRSICYIQGSVDGGRQYDIARSSDGGRTWTAGEALPALTFEWNAGLTCPQPRTCFVPFGPDLLATTDGFATFRMLPVTSAGDQVDWVSCPTVRRCVAEVRGAAEQMLYSDDGGATWATASAPTLPAGDIVIALRCDQGGACIAAVLHDAAAPTTVAALTSQDGGRSWTLSGSGTIPSMEQWMVSCGGGRDCVVGSNDGYLALMHAAKGGTADVRVMRFPKSWPAMAIAVSCATGGDCFAETADSAGTGYANATIEATHDAGRTWTSLGTPMAPAVPHDVAEFLSCPVPAGCVAIANDPSYAQRYWVVISDLSGRARGAGRKAPRAGASPHRSA